MKISAFLLLFVCLLGGYAHAQRSVQYGFNIGGGLGIQSVKDPEKILSNSIRTFNANLVVYVPVLNNYYIQTGLGLSDKGTLITEDALTTTNKIAYLELPVLLTRKYEVPTLGKIVVGLGGYFADGINGSINFETPSSNNFNYIDFGDGFDFKKYDAGASALLGLELDNRLTFNLGYDFGLYNIASQNIIDAGTTSVYNREFTITIGLLFSYKKHK